MRKLAIMLGVLIVVMLAGCGETTSTGNAGAASPTATPTTAAPTATTASSGGGAAAATITMGGSAFSGTKDVTIKAGQSVLFSDPGGVHNLVTGTHGQFTAAAGAPS